MFIISRKVFLKAIITASFFLGIIGMSNAETISDVVKGAQDMANKAGVGVDSVEIGETKRTAPTSVQTITVTGRFGGDGFSIGPTTQSKTRVGGDSGGKFDDTLWRSIKEAEIIRD